MIPAVRTDDVLPPWVRRPLFLLFLIAGLAAGLRLGAGILGGPAWFPIDTQIYLNEGVRISEGTPHGFFPNGFPLLIAALYLLVGVAKLPEAIIVFNVVASLIAVPLTYLIGREVANRSVALFAALAVAVFPNQINLVRFIMSEPMAAVLLIAAVYLLLRRQAFWSSVMLALAIVVRPSLLPIPLVLLGVMLVFGRSKKELGAFALGAVLIVGLHSTLLLTEVIAPARTFEYNVLMAISSTSSEGIEFTEVPFRTRFSEEERAHPIATYLQFASDSPQVFLKQRLSSLWELWGPWPTAGDAEHPRRLWVRVLIGLRFLIIVPAVVTFVRHIREERVWIMATPILVITAVHIAFFSTPRFTYVVEPFVIILATWFAVDLWHNRYGTRDQRATRVVHGQRGSAVASTTVPGIDSSN